MIGIVHVSNLQVSSFRVGLFASLLIEMGCEVGEERE